jgi:type VI secretion system protein ImpL
MMTLVKIVLWAVLAILVVVGIFLLGDFNDWPWWISLSLIVGLLGLVLGVFFVKKWLFRRSEKDFIKHITDEEDGDLSANQDHRLAKALDERFTEAVATLRSSRLKKHGQPLYVLPWYLFMGESGSGKTSAIKSSRLHSALTDVCQSSDTQGTKNCDWWFFDQAIILDTTGRYAISQDEMVDKAEWQQFLLLLARHRRREPINGLVVTVSAKKLLSADPDVLGDDGRTLRRRIDELMRAFGARFPVYVMVTKMDQIPGMEAFYDSLSGDALDHAMGQSIELDEDEPQQAVDRAIANLSDQLKDFRLVSLQSGKTEDPTILILPDALQRIRPNLNRFIDSVFERNPYLEPPLLRGLYFSSARQESLQSQLPSPLANVQPKIASKSPAFKGIFLKDFFTSILPHDRFMIKPIAEFVSWRKWTRNLGLLAELAIVLFLMGLLSLSFYKNLDTIGEFTTDFEKAPSPSGEMLQDLAKLREFHQKITKLEELNAGWLLPRMGLDSSSQMEESLKAEYCRLFKKGFLTLLSKKLEQGIADFSATTKGELIVAFVEHLGTRISLLNERLNEDSVPDSEDVPGSTFAGLSVADPGLIPKLVAQNILPYYLVYLRWNSDAAGLAKERTQLMDGLKQLALTKGTNLNWLVRWANIQNLEPVRIEDFFGDRITLTKAYAVPAAFTSAGRQKIEEFIAQYEAAVQDPEILRERKTKFTQWYRRQFANSWRKFALQFNPRLFHFRDEINRRELAQILTEPQNPYFSLLGKMSDELKFLTGQDKLPLWILQVINFKKVKAWASKPKLSGTAGRLAQAAKSVSKQASSELSSTELEKIAKEGDKFSEYKKGLSGLSGMTISSTAAFKIVSQLYSDSALSPIQTVYQALFQIRRLHLNARKENLYVALLAGPYNFLLRYALHETSAELQSQWDAMVRAEVRDVPDSKKREVLFDPSSGVVWQFAKGPARPFLRKGPRGYFSKKALSIAFPFKKQFLQYLNKGSSQTQMLLPRYEVTIRALPTSANRGALLEPHSTILVLDCISNRQKLENFNFPASQKFIWEPANCSDVSLTINFRDFSLSKRYPGRNGFLSFIKEFRFGSKTFARNDFPEKRVYLKQVNIKLIKVKFGFTGEKPLLDIARKPGGQPVVMPKAIILSTGV